MEIAKIIAIALDVIVLLILVGMVLSGMRKGFLVSLVNAAGYLVSCIGAYIGSRVLALTVYQMFLRDRLIADISEKLTDAVVDSDITLQISNAMEGVPAILRNMVYGFFGSTDDIAGMVGGQVMATANSVSTAVVDQVVYPVLYIVMQSLFFLLLFAALKVILSAVTETLRNLRKFPLVGTADTLAGAAMGFLEAVLVLFVVVLVIRFLISSSGDKIPFLSQETIDQTYLFKLLYKLSPFSGSWSSLE